MEKLPCFCNVIHRHIQHKKSIELLRNFMMKVFWIQQKASSIFTSCFEKSEV